MMVELTADLMAAHLAGAKVSQMVETKVVK